MNAFSSIASNSSDEDTASEGSMCDVKDRYCLCDHEASCDELCHVATSAGDKIFNTLATKDEEVKRSDCLSEHMASWEMVSEAEENTLGTSSNSDDDTFTHLFRPQNCPRKKLSLADTTLNFLTNGHTQMEEKTPSPSPAGHKNSMDLFIAHLAKTSPALMKYEKTVLLYLADNPEELLQAYHSREEFSSALEKHHLDMKPAHQIIMWRKLNEWQQPKPKEVVPVQTGTHHSSKLDRFYLSCLHKMITKDQRGFVHLCEVGIWFKNAFPTRAAPWPRKGCKAWVLSDPEHRFSVRGSSTVERIYLVGKPQNVTRPLGRPEVWPKPAAAAGHLP